jgi:hypothetical protein
MRFPDYFGEQNLSFRDNRGNVTPDRDPKKRRIAGNVTGPIGWDEID